MNFDNGFKLLEDALRRAGISSQSDTFLSFLGWKRKLLEIQEDEKKFGVVTIDMQVQREKALRELDVLALQYTGLSFMDLSMQQPHLSAPAPVPTSVPPNPVAAAATAPSDETFAYDVFISYSHHDKNWVQGWLLYQLRAANITFLIDTFDFHPGAPIVSEIERAVITSRKTLLVLSPDYLNSEWTKFENLLAFSLDPSAQTRRVIPLLLHSCDLPPRLQHLLYLDFTQSDQWIFQLGRLLIALKT